MFQIPKSASFDFFPIICTLLPWCFSILFMISFEVLDWFVILFLIKFNQLSNQNLDICFLEFCPIVDLWSPKWDMIWWWKRKLHCDLFSRKCFAFPQRKFVFTCKTSFEIYVFLQSHIFIHQKLFLKGHCPAEFPSTHQPGSF